MYAPQNVLYIIPNFSASSMLLVARGQSQE